jgi:hypothetical protein
VRLIRGASGRLIIDAFGTGPTALDMQYSGSIYSRLAQGSSGDLTLSTTGGATNHIILAPGGNVGIGSTTPSVPLSVTGDFANTGMIINYRSGTKWNFYGSGNDMYLGTDAAGHHAQA